MAKKVIRSIIAVLCSLALTGALVGCGGPAADSTANAAAEQVKETAAAVAEEKTEDAPAAEAPADVISGEEGRKVIAFVTQDMQGSFWIDMMNGGSTAAVDYGVDLMYKSSESSLEKQISIMENLINQKVDAIIVDPIDKDAVVPVIKKCGEAGIPVVTAGNLIDTGCSVSTVYNDTYDIGIITDIICKKIGEKGKVACIVGTPGSAVSDARQAGFESSVAKYTDVTPFTLAANWDATVAQQMVTDLLATDPDLDAVICADAVGYQVYQAATAAGKEGLLITNLAGLKENLQGIKDGMYILDLLMGGARIGYWNVATAARLTEGADVGDVLYLPTQIIANQDLIDKMGEWGINSVPACTPDEAIGVLDGYSEEFGPDNYDPANYAARQ